MNNLYFLENQEDLVSTNITANVKNFHFIQKEKKKAKEKKPNRRVFSQGFSNQHLIRPEILAFLLVSYLLTLQMTVAACLNITIAGAGKEHFRDAILLQSLQNSKYWWLS